MGQSISSDICRGQLDQAFNQISLAPPRLPFSFDRPIQLDLGKKKIPETFVCERYLGHGHHIFGTILLLNADSTNERIVMKYFTKLGHDQDTVLMSIIYKLQDIEQKIKNKSPHYMPWTHLFSTSDHKTFYACRSYLYSNMYDRHTSRPFITLVEKKWIAYQLMKFLQVLHNDLGVTHGDLKAENILLTTFNWVYVTDLCSIYKSTFNKPISTGDYFFYYDPGRKSCTIAPERFISAIEDYSSDIFSLGCILYELFMIDGNGALFDLSLIKRYSNDEISLESIFQIHEHSQSLDCDSVLCYLKPMLSRLSSNRPDISSILNDWKREMFPSCFYNFLYDYFIDVLLPLGSYERLERLYLDVSIIQEKITKDINIILISFVCSHIRSVSSDVDITMKALILLERFGIACDSFSVCLDRIIPYLIWFLDTKQQHRNVDIFIIIKIHALRILIHIMKHYLNKDSIRIPHLDTFLFQDYLLPVMKNCFLYSDQESLKIAYSNHLFDIYSLSFSFHKGLEPNVNVNQDDILESLSDSLKHDLTYLMTTQSSNQDNESLIRKSNTINNIGKLESLKWLKQSIIDHCIALLFAILNEPHPILHISFYESLPVSWLHPSALEDYLLAIVHEHLMNSCTASLHSLTDSILKFLHQTIHKKLKDAIVDYDGLDNNYHCCIKILDMILPLLLHPMDHIRQHVIRIISVLLNKNDTEFLALIFIRPKIVPFLVPDKRSSDNILSECCSCMIVQNVSIDDWNDIIERIRRNSSLSLKQLCKDTNIVNKENELAISILLKWMSKAITINKFTIDTLSCPFIEKKYAMSLSRTILLDFRYSIDTRYLETTINYSILQHPPRGVLLTRLGLMAKRLCKFRDKLLILTYDDPQRLFLWPIIDSVYIDSLGHSKSGDMIKCDIDSNITAIQGMFDELISIGYDSGIIGIYKYDYDHMNLWIRIRIERESTTLSRYAKWMLYSGDKSLCYFTCITNDGCILSYVLNIDSKQFECIYEQIQSPLLGFPTSCCIQSSNYVLIGTNRGIICMWDLRFGVLTRKWKLDDENAIVSSIIVLESGHYEFSSNDIEEQIQQAIQDSLKGDLNKAPWMVCGTMNKNSTINCWFFTLSNESCMGYIIEKQNTGSLEGTLHLIPGSSGFLKIDTNGCMKWFDLLNIDRSFVIDSYDRKRLVYNRIKGVSELLIIEEHVHSEDKLESSGKRISKHDIATNSFSYSTEILVSNLSREENIKEQILIVLDCFGHLNIWR